MLLVPILFFTIIFYVYPMIEMLGRSLWNEGFTLTEYINIFRTDLYYSVFFRSLQLATMVTLFGLMLGYPLAYYIVYSDRKIILLGIVAISMWLGIIIRS